VNQFNIILFSGEVWFHHSGNVQTHNTFPVLIHEVPLPDKVGLWCATSQTRITGPTFFYDTIKSHQYVTHSDINFWIPVKLEETYSFFQQGSPKALAKNYSIHCLQSIFGDRILTTIVGSLFIWSEDVWFLLVEHVKR
jgi:hypothetical protein